MDILQKQPSEIRISETDVRLVLRERANPKWLLGMLGFWAVGGTTPALVLHVINVPDWLIVVPLLVTLSSIIMTLLAWVTSQTFICDRTTQTFSWSQRYLLGSSHQTTQPLNQLLDIQLVPKTHNQDSTCYINLYLVSGATIELDFSSSGAVDRKIVERVRRFLTQPAATYAQAEFLRD